MKTNDLNRAARGPLLLGVAALAVLVLGFGVWAVTTTLAGAIVATGRIEVEQNRQAIQHPDGGVVAELLVQEGARVEEGQVLVQLEAADLRTELRVARTQLAELGARRARLETERDGGTELMFPDMLLAEAELADIQSGQTELFNARAETLAREIEQSEGRIEQIGAQVQALQSQETALRDQIALADAEIIRLQDLLDRDVGTRAPLVQVQQQQIQLRGTMGEVAARRAEAAERIIETELAILQLQIERREQAITELRDVQAAEQELSERTRLLERQIDRLDLRAPVAGTIHGLTIFGARSVLRPADPFAYIIPEGRPLVITAQIAAVDIDEVFPGQAATLQFQAFDQSDMPEVTGLISRISADAFVDETTGLSFYRTEIALPEDQVALLGARALVPGMPVDAFIRTADRSPMTYLIEPFVAYFGRALRES